MSPSGFKLHRLCNLSVIAASLLLFQFVPSAAQAGINYASWYTGIGGGGINYPFHTVSPFQVKLFNDNGGAGTLDDTFGHAGGGGEFRVENVNNSPLGSAGIITYSDIHGISRIFQIFFGICPDRADNCHTRML